MKERDQIKRILGDKLSLPPITIIPSSPTTAECLRIISNAQFKHMTVTTVYYVNNKEDREVRKDCELVDYISIIEEIQNKPEQWNVTIEPPTNQIILTRNWSVLGERVVDHYKFFIILDRKRETHSQEGGVH